MVLLADTNTFYLFSSICAIALFIYIAECLFTLKDIFFSTESFATKGALAIVTTMIHKHPSLPACLALSRLQPSRTGREGCKGRRTPARDRQGGRAGATALCSA